MARPSIQSGWLRRTVQLSDDEQQTRTDQRSEERDDAEVPDLVGIDAEAMRAVRKASIRASKTPSAAIAPYDGMTNEPMWKRTGCT